MAKTTAQSADVWVKRDENYNIAHHLSTIYRNFYSKQKRYFILIQQTNDYAEINVVCGLAGKLPLLESKYSN